MPVSSHLLRKLQESLGADAATDLVNILDDMESLRADVAELRHQMLREFETVRTRLDGMATKADLRLTQVGLVFGFIAVLVAVFYRV